MSVCLYFWICWAIILLQLFVCQSMKSLILNLNLEFNFKFSYQPVFLHDKTSVQVSNNFRSGRAFNPCAPNAVLLYPLKTSENLTVFWCFQGVEKGSIGNEKGYVKQIGFCIFFKGFSAARNCLRRKSRKVFYMPDKIERNRLLKLLFVHLKGELC